MRYCYQQRFKGHHELFQVSARHLFISHLISSFIFVFVLNLFSPSVNLQICTSVRILIVLFCLFFFFRLMSKVGRGLLISKGILNRRNKKVWVVCIISV